MLQVVSKPSIKQRKIRSTMTEKPQVDQIHALHLGLKKMQLEMVAVQENVRKNQEELLRKQEEQLRQIQSMFTANSKNKEPQVPNATYGNGETSMNTAGRSFREGTNSGDAINTRNLRLNFPRFNVEELKGGCC